MAEKDRRSVNARFQAVVHGRVQGVSFRFHTRQRARAVGVSGHVRNLGDGTVEVVAEGARPNLETLLSFLRVGPRGAFVTKVDVQWRAPVGAANRFEVRI